MPDRTCAWPDCERGDIMVRGLCSRCLMRARRSGRLDEFEAPARTCEHCRCSFAAGSRSGNVFCSAACRLGHRRERLAIERADLLCSRQCEGCGATVPSVRRADAVYCSIICQQGRWYQANEERLRAASILWKCNNRERALEADHRRRARKMGNGVERIDRKVVWLRDHGRCWLCEQAIDPTLRAPNPLSPSLDHIVPISRGGGHLMANVAMAHLRCNISKKDKMPDRLPSWSAGGVVTGAMAAESA